MAIRWSINLESELTSIQRLFEYIDLPKECIDASQGDKTPLRGMIEFKSVEMRYRPELNPALRNLSFKVEAG